MYHFKNNENTLKKIQVSRETLGVKRLFPSLEIHYNNSLNSTVVQKQ